MIPIQVALDALAFAGMIEGGYGWCPFCHYMTIMYWPTALWAPRADPEFRQGMCVPCIRKNGESNGKKFA